MKCEDIQQQLSLYGDDGLSAEERANCNRHLEVCPVCRAQLAELRSLKRALALLPVAAAPANLTSTINQTIVSERAAQQRDWPQIIGEFLLEWLQPVFARYAFSSVASIVLFTIVFVAMRPQMIALREASVALDQVALTEPTDLLAPAYDIRKPISPQSYAALRTPYNIESPSLNPRGSLALLAFPSDYAARRPRQHQDDMVVVADVFSNGTASLADVVHAPRDRRMLDEFQKALRHDAAFVPAALDRRPETMRVVFSVQRVDVRDGATDRY